VLAIYLGAVAYTYRGVYHEWRKRRGEGPVPRSCMPEPEKSFLDRPLVRFLGIVAFVILGGLMVLAGSGLVFDSGNLAHGLPISSHEFVLLMKDVIPGMISIVLGFLLLEMSNRTLGGKGLRHG
jgi:hypothetical protein